MIYKKEANFPYPILSATTFSYQANDFSIKIDFEENNDAYRFTVTPKLPSTFIANLLQEGKAQYVLVIQSKDTKFFVLDQDLRVDIPKNRMSLSSRTSIQVHIVSKTTINFATNTELTSFYAAMKEHITLEKNVMLGFSNIVTFEGSMKNPLTLFEKRLDPNLASAVKYELGTECIVISFRDEAIQFQALAKSSPFLNPYLYTGLRIAIERFIKNYAEEDEDWVDISQILTPDDLLDFKLYNLMKNKAVEQVNVSNIDEVIAQISNRLIEKYVAAVKELATNED